MFWPHTKIPTYRDCLQQTPVSALPPLLSATADKGVQTTSNKTTDNNFHTHYILYLLRIFCYDWILPPSFKNQIQKPITKLRPYYCFYTRFDASLQEKFISN